MGRVRLALHAVLYLKIIILRGNSVAYFAKVPWDWNNRQGNTAMLLRIYISVWYATFTYIVLKTLNGLLSSDQAVITPRNTNLSQRVSQCVMHPRRLRVNRTAKSIKPRPHWFRCSVYFVLPRLTASGLRSRMCVMLPVQKSFWELMTSQLPWYSAF